MVGSFSILILTQGGLVLFYKKHAKDRHRLRRSAQVRFARIGAKMI